MAGTIRLDAEQMNYYANRLAKYREQMEEILKKLDECMGRLAEEWAGESYEEYAKQYEEIKTAYAASIEYVQRFSDAMTQTYNNFVNVDGELAKAIRS